MVRISYDDINESYRKIKESACGRQACSVMILVACEVKRSRREMVLALSILTYSSY